MAGWGVVGRWVPGGRLLVVARPGPPLVLGRLPDWEHLRLLLG